MFRNKIILITGGTGSFGTTMLKKLLKTNVKEIRILSRDEKKQEDLRRSIKDKRINYIIGDIRDVETTLSASKNVDFVFQAAALKQVPTCEFFPLEAYKTNVIGTSNIIDSSIKNRVKKIVILSTDKAVYPINAMGISKAMMEKYMVSKSRLLNKDSTIFCATRYGNVMGSRGSVIPLFISQIKSGKPLSITDPSMTRFLMSLEESMDLVLYAFKHGEQGDIFVQKAPACEIQVLAKALIQILNSNVSMNIIGTRHGEKLYETLVSREELSRAMEIGNYFRIKSDDRDLNYDNFFKKGKKKISLSQDYTSHNTKQLNVEEVKEILLKLNFIKKELNV